VRPGPEFPLGWESAPEPYTRLQGFPDSGPVGDDPCFTVRESGRWEAEQGSCSMADQGWNRTWTRPSMPVLALGSFALALLVVDHWAHVLGWLPYLLLLACPLMHLMHGRQHGTGDRPAARRHGGESHAAPGERA
jgi:hypothetical protein